MATARELQWLLSASDLRAGTITAINGSSAVAVTGLTCSLQEKPAGFTAFAWLTMGHYDPSSDVNTFRRKTQNVAAARKLDWSGAAEAMVFGPCLEFDNKADNVIIDVWTEGAMAQQTLVGSARIFVGDMFPATPPTGIAYPTTDGGAVVDKLMVSGQRAARLPLTKNGDPVGDVSFTVLTFGWRPLDHVPRAGESADAGGGPGAAGRLDSDGASRHSSADGVEGSGDKDDVEEDDDGASSVASTASATSAPSVAEERPVAEMREGDWQVHAHVIQARHLKGDRKGTLDPVVHVEIGDQKQNTPIHEQATDVIFDHQMSFFFPRLAKEDAEALVATLSVYDAHGLRDKLVGRFSFDIQDVYNQKAHTYEKRWVGLSDPDNEGDSSFRGFVQVTFVVKGPGDTDSSASQALLDAAASDKAPDAPAEPESKPGGAQPGAAGAGSSRTAAALTPANMAAGVTAGASAVSALFTRGDAAKNAEEQLLAEHVSDQNAEMDVLLPPRVQRELRWLVITVFRADGLPDCYYGLRDALGGARGINAYVEASFAGSRVVRTNRKWSMGKGDLSVVWKEELRIPYYKPALSSRIEIALMHHTTSAFVGAMATMFGAAAQAVGLKQSTKVSTSRVGTILLKLKDVEDGHAAHPAWWPVYSGPLNRHVPTIGGDLSVASRMQRLPDIASTFNGRVMLSVRVVSDLDAHVVGAAPRRGKSRRRVLEPAKAEVAHSVAVVVTKDDKRFLRAATLTLPQVRYRLWALVIAAESIPECKQQSSPSGPDDVAIAVCIGSAPPQYTSLISSRDARGVPRDGRATFSTLLQSHVMLPADPKSTLAPPPDVFVYLTRGRLADGTIQAVPVSFERISTKALLEGGDKASSPHWLALRPDTVINAVRGDEIGGCVLVRVALERDTEHRPSLELRENVHLFLERQKNDVVLKGDRLPVAAPPQTPQLSPREREWEEDRVPRTSRFAVRLHLYQGRSLPPQDDPTCSGSIRPIVLLQLAGKKVQTEVLSRATTSPAWYKTLLLPDLELPKRLDFSPLLHVELYHQSKFGAKIFVSELRYNLARPETIRSTDPLQLPKELDRPKWFALKRYTAPENDDTQYGELLFNVEVIDLPYTTPLPRLLAPDIAPRTAPGFLDAVVIGCRALKGKSWFPVLFPRVILELGGVSASDGSPEGRRGKKSAALPPIRLPERLKLSTAKDPNFCWQRTVPIDIPEEALFAPTINFSIADKNMWTLGMTDSNIGSGVISLEDKVPGVDQQRLPAYRRHNRGPPAPEGNPFLAPRRRAPGHSDDDLSAGAALDADLRPPWAKQLADVHAANAAAATATSLSTPLIPTGSVQMHATPPSGTSFSVAAPADRFSSTGSGAAKSLHGYSSQKPAEVELVVSAVGAGVHRGGAGVGSLAPVAASSPNPSAPALELNPHAALDKRAKDEWGIDLTGWKDAAAGVEDPKVAAYLSGRREYDRELERVFNSKPFESYTIQRGKTKQAGTLKGVFRVSRSRAVAPSVDLVALRTSKTYKVRVYVLTGSRLIAGRSGAVNPYVTVRLGGQVSSKRDAYINADSNPAFYSAFELMTQLPGLSDLSIEVWDRKVFRRDDLIGASKVDLEDRLFDPAWQALGRDALMAAAAASGAAPRGAGGVPLKPLERRTLYSKTSKEEQGSLLCWVDLLTPEEARLNPLLDIARTPPAKFQLRVVIWKTQELDKKGNLRVVADVSGKAQQAQKRTDVHRSTRSGSWNWRMLWSVELQMRAKGDEKKFNSVLLKFQLFDTRKGFLGQRAIDIVPHMKRALKAAPSGVHVEGDPLRGDITAAEERSRLRITFDAHADDESGGDGDEDDATGGGSEGGADAVGDGSAEATAAPERRSGGMFGGMLGSMMGLGNPLAMLRKAITGRASKWGNVDVDAEPEFGAWLPLREHIDSDGSADSAGRRLLVSIELLPVALAAEKKAGDGRTAPNAYPELPPPAGRGWCSLSFAGCMRFMCSNRIALGCCCCLVLVLVVFIVLACMPLFNLLKTTIDADLPPQDATPVKWALLAVALLLFCAPPCCCYVYFVGCCGFCGAGRVQRKRVFIRGFAAAPPLPPVPSAPPRSAGDTQPASPPGVGVTMPRPVAPQPTAVEAKAKRQQPVRGGGGATAKASSAVRAFGSHWNEESELSAHLLSPDERDRGDDV